jgi:transcriptional regulator with XRE-family HTH domain
MPQKELASILQLSTQQLGNIENGKEKDLGICKILEISIALKIIPILN